MDESKYLSVSALNKYLYYKFDNDLNLRNLYIKAEISNVRLSKGILYFVLKDNESEIDGIMFSNVLNTLKFEPMDGMTVLVNGQVTLYPKRGTYSVRVFSMEQVGLGEAYLNFLMLKEKLMNEGLFDEEKKLAIPTFPKAIGLITSGTGDAMHDVISTIDKRYPLAKVYLYPAIVQGEDAPRSLINQINKANRDGIVDVIIIARGGGSLEDLSCFNDEELARTIFESMIPTISGVGHEADFTICDFVSSRRAPTPTGAAVIATPNISDIYSDLLNKKQLLASSMKAIFSDKVNQYKMVCMKPAFSNFVHRFDEVENRLNSLTSRLKTLSPVNRIENSMNELSYMVESLNKNYISYIDKVEYRFNKDINKLIILNPLNLMDKGYSLTYQDDKLIKDINEIDENKMLKTVLKNGTIESKIININNGDNYGK